jgi:hypothetical protein
MSDQCLSLLAAPEIEEKLLDWLLLFAGAATYTSQSVARHGVRTANLDPLEQVLGRGDAVLVKILIEQEAAGALISTLGKEFAGVGMHYWLTPVDEQGEL